MRVDFLACSVFHLAIALSGHVVGIRASVTRVRRMAEAINIKSSPLPPLFRRRSDKGIHFFLVFHVFEPVAGEEEGGALQVKTCSSSCEDQSIASGLPDLIWKEKKSSVNT
ncbi:hypothetical protein HPP92_020928 [Vanilla planifolia]|uniref:Uncharacterized protein n=1 Tax=Vanilla planifolia TaxID=51239 RepID=A0A835Q3S9_VANPL|nr:hypothetical protein HPP92_020928 [Vanilla planifolia]